MKSRDDIKALLEGAFRAGVRAGHPDVLMANQTVQQFLEDIAPLVTGRVLVIGAGKASAAMAAAFAHEWSAAGDSIDTGLIITRDGYNCPAAGLDVRCAGHPYADDRSTKAAQDLLAMVQDLDAGDLVVGLWSGGGSALLTAPLPGIAAADLQAITKALVDAGADILEINAVRRHLSLIAGGKLARAAAPAQLLNFILPDVSGADDEELSAAVASGPMVPDPSTLADALSVLGAYGIELSPAIADALNDPANETPKSWQEIGATGTAEIMLPARAAQEGAARFLEPHFGDAIQFIEPDAEGDAHGVAAAFADAFAEMEGERTVFIGGGEVTTRVTGFGAGGPNQEFALALALALDGTPGVYALSGDTDGTDGVGGGAGAFIAPDTLERLSEAGVDAAAALRNNDAGGAFAAIGDQLVTGPTFTNLNDLRLVVTNG